MNSSNDEVKNIYKAKRPLFAPSVPIKASNFVHFKLKSNVSLFFTSFYRICFWTNHLTTHMKSDTYYMALPWKKKILKNFISTKARVYQNRENRAVRQKKKTNSSRYLLPLIIVRCGFLATLLNHFSHLLKANISSQHNNLVLLILLFWYFLFE